jgi:hypothetical protein
MSFRSDYAARESGSAASGRPVLENPSAMCEESILRLQLE